MPQIDPASLAQLAAAYPPTSPFLDLAARKAYHRSGENMLAWQPALAAAGQRHRLAPGDAPSLYMGIA